MPGKDLDVGLNDRELKCVRCSELKATLLVRSEHLCKDCFITYVRTKVIKRMESYRVRNSTKDKPRTLLLPLSLGASSVCLLHILDYQLQTQIDRTQRAGYKLHVLVICPEDPCIDVTYRAKFEDIRRRYPRHTYTLLSLAHIFEGTRNPDQGILGVDSALISALAAKSASKKEKLDALLSTFPSATSRSDFLGILRTRLIVDFAKEEGCEGVFWGDSTTRLAEKTIAETAKGRGCTLPWQISDGASPHGLNFKYPLRDLLRKELVLFTSLTSPPLTSCLLAGIHTAQLSASAKNSTIDDLMSQYFESVEENYPSIVANVVRTSSKLDPLQAQDYGLNCELCAMPVHIGSSGLHNWGGDQHELVVGTETMTPSNRFCYGCTRSMLGSKVAAS